MNRFITYYLYPLVLFSTIGLFVAAVSLGWDLTVSFAVFAGLRFALLLAVEFIFPCKPEWGMTKFSFLRDLKWIAVGLVTTKSVAFLISLAAIDLAAFNTGIISNTSIFVEFLVISLAYEFFQYWFHRYCHEGKGKVGSFFWRIHVTHHLPDRVYLLMHGVFHPINMLVARLFIHAALLGLGARAESIFLFNGLLGLHALLSHYNVDIKAGPLNYIFIGTELHRYHHSVKLEDAKNYGSFLSIWDLVFRTFRFDPNRLPERLGIEDRDAYPQSHEVLKLLALPFRPETRSRT